MDFRLIYQGPLASNGDARQKHTIRKMFHKQLAELFKQHPQLREQSERRVLVYTTPHNQVSFPGPNVRQILDIKEHPSLDQPGRGRPWIQWVADDHTKFGYRFVPLISKKGGFSCSLNILFLRRDNPGHLVLDGGDIDNRLKTLFDGLRMPDNLAEAAGCPPEASEDPFFCLLEDDRLVTAISVITDRLLTPVRPEEGEQPKHVHLVIHVTMNDLVAPFTSGRLI